MILDARSESQAEEIAVFSNNISSGGYSGTAYVRVVAWWSDDKMHFKWQKRQDGFNYVRWDDAREFSVSAGGATEAHLLVLGTAVRNWEDFSSIYSISMAADFSGSVTVSGYIYWNASKSVTAEIAIQEESEEPSPGPTPSPPEPYVDDETVEYSAYIDGNLLYYPGMRDYAITEPVIEMEINHAGSFSFSMPSVNINAMLGEIPLRKATVEVRQGNYILFRGRPLTENGGMDALSKYYCEGCLAYLNDSLIDPGKYSRSAKDLMEYYFSEHNRQCDLFGEEDRKLDFVYSDMTAQVTVKYEKYVTTMQAVTDLIAVIGGYLYPVYDGNSTGFAYVSSFSEQGWQRIQFGQNLLEYTWKRDASQIVNVVRAVGGENDEYQYHAQDDDSIARYGRSAKVIYPSDIKSIDDARRAAKSELSKNPREKRTIKIGAIDLHLLNPRIRRLRVGTVVEVATDSTSNFLCTRARIDLADPRRTVYYFGEETSKIAGMV